MAGGRFSLWLDRWAHNQIDRLFTMLRVASLVASRLLAGDELSLSQAMGDRIAHLLPQPPAMQIVVGNSLRSHHRERERFN